LNGTVANAGYGPDNGFGHRWEVLPGSRRTRLLAAAVEPVPTLLRFVAGIL